MQLHQDRAVVADDVRGGQHQRLAVDRIDDRPASLGISPSHHHRRPVREVDRRVRPRRGDGIGGGARSNYRQRSA